MLGSALLERTDAVRELQVDVAVQGCVVGVWPADPLRLAKDFSRIDSRRSPGRKPSRDGADDKQEDHAPAEDGRVARFHSIQQGLDQARSEHAENQADRDTRQRDAPYVRQHRLNDSTSLRTKGQANREFGSTPRHGLGRRAIQAERRQQEG